MHDLAPRLAELLVNYNIPIEKGELVVINGSLEALPLAKELAKAVIRKGGLPTTLLQMPDMAEYMMMHGTDEQLEAVNPFQKYVYETADVIFSIEAPSHTRALVSVDPSRMQLAMKSHQPIMSRFMERLTSGELRWNLSAYPTRAAAQEANMSFLAYEKFIYEAYGLHLDDPVAHWMGVRDQQTRYVDWLADKKHVEVKGPGIDLTFDMKDRSWVSCHGDKNFPDGEIFTGPIEESVNGTVEFSYPNFYLSQQVDGIKLRFENGKVVEASAEKNEELLLTQSDVDAGARYLGEFAIGTNRYIQNVTGSTLFDEKIGGTIHMAIGHSLPETGGVNQSAVHWDMVHNMRDGGEIWVDGELFYQSGEFLVD